MSSLSRVSREEFISDNKGRLNDGQMTAVLSDADYSLVVAGAGTGKTTVLTKRFEYLVKVKGMDPERILMVTFTNKATSEMKGRVKKFGINSDHIQTFHKTCMSILEKEGIKFDVCNDARAKKVIEKIVKKNGYEIKAFARTRDIVHRLKWKYWRTGEFDMEDIIEIMQDIIKWSREKIMEKVSLDEIRVIYNDYIETLRKESLLDFDDILIEANRLLDDETVRSKWDDKFQAVLFDEFQDIDEIQFEVIKKLSLDSKDLFVVGDPDQSIYGFRGAVPDSFKKFQATFPGTQIFKLTTNYRSTPQILEVANHLINVERDELSKDLTTDNPVGRKPRFMVLPGLKNESDYVISEIYRIQKEKKVPFKSFAILYRSRTREDDLQNNLLRKRVPFISKELIRNFNSTEFKDVIAWLTIGFEDTSSEKMTDALKRVINKPARGVGPAKIKKIEEEAKKKGCSFFDALKTTSVTQAWSFLKIVLLFRDIANSKVDLVEKIEGFFDKDEASLFRLMEKDNKKHRIDDVRAFLESILQDKEASDELFKRIKDLTDYGVKSDKMYVGTIHSAKGLEFEYVFLIRWEENRFPIHHVLRAEKRSVENSKERLAEERRVGYVAVTRARKELCITCGGKNISRFVKDIVGFLELSQNIEFRENERSVFKEDEGGDAMKDDNDDAWINDEDDYSRDDKE